MTRPPLRFGSLSRKEWALVALGLATWVALGAFGVWFVHQLIRPKEGCGTALESRTTQVKGTGTGPANAFQLLTGQGSCK